MAFGRLKNSTLNRGDLFIHAIIPLAFVYEFAYQLKPLLTRLGSFFPVLCRQFGVNLDFLTITASPGVVTFWQVAFLLGGMALSSLFLQILIRKHQAEKTSSKLFSSLKWLPIMVWGAIYIGIFL